jgi:predicted transcriptional regulator of viral defense system
VAPPTAAPGALRLTHLSLRRGRRARLRFTASLPGRVTIDVRRGARRVARRVVRVRAGRVSVRLPRLRPGRYVVVVRAAGGRAHRLRLRVARSAA